MNNPVSPVEKTVNYAICGARRKNGTKCLRPSGWGTTHPGVGVCKLHGGSALQTYTKKINLKHFSADIANRAKELSQAEDILELDKEIGIARALLETAVYNNNEDLLYQKMLLDEIGKLVATKHKIEMDKQGYIRVAFVKDLMDAWMQAVQSNISDLVLRRQILSQVENQMRGKIPLILPQAKAIVESTSEEVNLEADPEPYPAAPEPAPSVFPLVSPAP